MFPTLYINNLDIILLRKESYEFHVVWCFSCWSNLFCFQQRKLSLPGFVNGFNT